MANPDADRRLAALVFVELDQTRDAFNHSRIKAGRHQGLDTFVVLHVALQDRVQHLIRGQAVLVGLVGAQLRAGRTRDDALRDRVLASAVGVVLVAPARQLEDCGLEQVLDDRKSAGHVAIERAVTGGHLTLVAGGQHDRAELVGQRHEKHTAYAGLDVFFGGVFGPALELSSQRSLEGLKLRRDRYLVVTHLHTGSHVAGVYPGNIGRVGGRHHHGADIVRAQRIDGDGQHQGRVNATG